MAGGGVAATACFPGATIGTMKTVNAMTKDSHARQ